MTSYPLSPAQEEINELIQRYPPLANQARIMSLQGIEPRRALRRLINFTESPSYELIPLWGPRPRQCKPYLRVLQGEG